MGSFGLPALTEGTCLIVSLVCKVDNVMRNVGLLKNRACTQLPFSAKRVRSGKGALAPVLITAFGAKLIRRHLGFCAWTDVASRSDSPPQASPVWRQRRWT